MLISVGARRSFPGESGLPPPPRSHRAAALIIGAMVLLAAFLVVAPYLSSALKQGYSIISGSNATGPSTTATLQGSSTSSGQGGASTDGTNGNSCSSVVAVKSLADPDIKNGSADIAYPADYCTLAAYALGLINQDRADNGTRSVTLDYNQAAQQHADSMLYYGYFSHFDVQGYKPYMRYTLLGGVGADFENVAYYYYSAPYFLSTGSVETAMQELEHAMVYNDSSCCQNGHRYNILDPLHNHVSIGVAYDGKHVYFDEEFENDYIALGMTTTGPSAQNPFYVTMSGTPTQAVPSPNSIFIAYDATPSAMTPTEVNSLPHEYGPGNLTGGVTPRGFLGYCPQFTSGTTVCADKWTFNSKAVDIAFSLQPFVKQYGSGVYTVYLVTGDSTNSAITTVSIFVPSVPA